MLASVCVAISIPVTLSSKVMVVTNTTAMRSPASDGTRRQGKAASCAGFHGSACLAEVCASNSQPAACACASELPPSWITRWVMATAANRTPGRTKALLARRKISMQNQRDGKTGGEFGG